jgi:hypothetical protein
MVTLTVPWTVLVNTTPKVCLTLLAWARNLLCCDVTGLCLAVSWVYVDCVLGLLGSGLDVDCAVPVLHYPPNVALCGTPSPARLSLLCHIAFIHRARACGSASGIGG